MEEANMASLNLPMPGNGIDIFAKNFMKDMLERKQFAFKNSEQERLKKQFADEMELKKQAAEQARQNHLDSLGLQRHAQSRLDQMLPFRLQALKDAHSKSSPDYEINQIKKLYELAMQPQNGNNPVPENNNLLKDQLTSMGMFGQEIPQGQGSMQAQEPQEQVNKSANTTPNLMQMIVGGALKKKTGTNPFAQQPQTPEQKINSQLELFKEKERIKAAKEEKMPAAIKTLHENIIHLSPKAIDAIDHIINIPSPTEIPGTGFYKSGQKAAHNKAVTAAAENYSKAKGWPNTKGSIEKAESILQRGNWETDYDYHKRLEEYKDELKSGIKSSNDFLHPGKNESTTNLPDNNIIEYERVNGKLVPKKR